MQFKLIALLTLAIASVNGAAIQKRAGGTCNCGGTVYNSAIITAAVGQSAHGPFGFRHYPHAFNNREGFSFPGCSGSLLEFPILKSGRPFDGSGGPGPDRVIFTTSGTICGCITHTGASLGGFNQCT